MSLKHKVILAGNYELKEQAIMFSGAGQDFHSFLC